MNLENVEQIKHAAAFHPQASLLEHAASIQGVNLAAKDYMILTDKIFQTTLVASALGMKREDVTGLMPLTGRDLARALQRLNVTSR